MDVNRKNAQGLTPLMQAAMDGRKDAVNRLIRIGADVNAKSSCPVPTGRVEPRPQNMTALMYAAMNGHVDIVKILIEHGADVNAEGDLGDSYDHGWYGDHQVFPGGRFLPNSGQTALGLAVKEGHAETVNVLIDAGADVNAWQYNSRETVLMYAASRGDAEIVKVLIAAGADVNVQTKFGETALMYAAGSGNIERVKVLIAAGADVNAQTKSGSTALVKAANEGLAETVKVLLAAGADVNAQDEDDEKTTLINAVEWNYKEIIHLLKAAGAK